MRELLKLVEALPDQDGKVELVEKIKELIGEAEAPVYALEIPEIPGTYTVFEDNDGTWSWYWLFGGLVEDGYRMYPTYRSAVRDIKRDLRDNVQLYHDDRVRYLNALDKEIH